MPISSTRLSCPLRSKVYVTSPVGSAFDPGFSPGPTPHSLQPLPPSPCRISLTSGPADYGRVYHSPLPPLPPRKCGTAGLLGSADITPLLRYYEPIRHRLAVSHFPGLAGYMTYPAPPISRWDEDGLSSCLVCPCHRAVPTTPPKSLVASVNCDDRCCLRPLDGGSAFSSRRFEATNGFICITAR
jgi:hypothetical protein